MSLQSELRIPQKAESETHATSKQSKSKTPNATKPINNLQKPHIAPTENTLWRLMVGRSLSAPISSKLLLASLLKNVFSWRFVLLISLPIIVANAYWLANVNLAGVESTARNWLNASHYWLYVFILLGLVLVAMLSVGFQALLFPYGVSGALQQERISWRQANAKFFSQLVIVVSKWIVAAAILLLSLYVVVSRLESLAQLLQPVTVAKIILLFVAATLIAIAAHVSLQMAQLICLQSNTGIFRSVLRSLHLQLSHFAWFCAEIVAQFTNLVVQVGLLFVTTAGVYWGLVSLSNNPVLQTVIFVGLFLAGLLILVWLDLINWQQWAGVYRWVESRLKPTQLRLVKTHQSLPERTWPVFVYLLFVVMVLAALLSTANSASSTVQASMTQLQNKLPNSSQRIVPSSRNIRYNIP